MTSVSTVNTDVVGSYSVTYSVSDTNGNAAAEPVKNSECGGHDETGDHTAGRVSTETVEAKGNLHGRGSQRKRHAGGKFDRK